MTPQEHRTASRVIRQCLPKSWFHVVPDGWADTLIAIVPYGDICRLENPTIEEKRKHPNR